MKNFFDIHCHILPYVDDGAKNLEETLEMLTIAYKDGIRNIIATSHFHPRRGHKEGKIIKEQMEKVCQSVRERFPDLHLYAGHEIYDCHDAVEKLKVGEILTLNDSQYVLVEFSFTEDVRRIKSGLNKYILNGYHPILAHVERYEKLVKDWDALEELTEAGVYLQVNGESLLGKMGGSRKRFVKKLLQADMVSFIATDAHDSEKRRPLLSKAAEYVEKKFGKEVTERIFMGNPQNVIENNTI